MVPSRLGYLIGVPFHVVPELVLVRIGLGFGRRLAETFERRLAINGTGEVIADASLHCQLGNGGVQIARHNAAKRFQIVPKPHLGCCHFLPVELGGISMEEEKKRRREERKKEKKEKKEKTGTVSALVRQFW